MTTSTLQGITVRLDATGSRPFIVIDIPQDLWKGNDGIEHPNNARMFDGSLVINGSPMHLQAIQVEVDGSLVQGANAAEYAQDLNSLSQLNGDSGAFVTSPSIEAGQEFVVYAVPYEA